MASPGQWRMVAYIGLFHNKQLGTYRVYATHRHKCEVLEIEKRTLVITPDNPLIFCCRSTEASIQRYRTNAGLIFPKYMSAL